MSVARRLQDIEPFLAVEVAERAQELERQGVDVVHLGYGEPDFAPPAVVQEALARAVQRGQMRYTHSLGILPLREAIADHYGSTYGVKVSPEQILVTPGTSPAMLLLFGALLDPGDEVVLSDPYYACYPNFIRYAEGVPVCVDTTEEDGFQYPVGQRLLATDAGEYPLLEVRSVRVGDGPLNPVAEVGAGNTAALGLDAGLRPGAGNG